MVVVVVHSRRSSSGQVFIRGAQQSAIKCVSCSFSRCMCVQLNLSLSLSLVSFWPGWFFSKKRMAFLRVEFSEWSSHNTEREKKKIEEADERELEGAGLKFPRCSWMYFSRPHIVTYNTNMTADYARTRKKSQTNKTNNKTNKKEKKNYIAYTMLYNIYMIHQASVLIRNTIR